MDACSYRRGGSLRHRYIGGVLAHRTQRRVLDMSSDRANPHLAAIALRGFALRCRRAIGAAALIAAGTFATGASSCGYEDPSSVMVQRGVLNLSYPNALYVVGALTQARMEGVVGRPTAAPASKDLFGSQFHMTARMLEQFAGALRIDVRDDMAFSMVLIEPMLWNSLRHT